MSADKKYIRFIDSHYKDLFYVPDGGSVRVTSGYDGSVNEYVCKYIDQTHLEISNNVYHICQLAELMERNGNKIEPVREIGDLDFYKKRYYDYENIDKEGQTIPYYVLIRLDFNKGTSSEVDIDYAFCLKPGSSDKTFCKFAYYPYNNVDGVNCKKEFSSDIYDLCGDDKLCERINNIVKAIKDEATKTVDELLHNAKAQSDVHAQEKADVSYEL